MSTAAGSAVFVGAAWSAAGLLAATLTISALLLAHHAVRTGRWRRQRRAVRDAARLLAPHLVDPERLGEAVEEARRRFDDRTVATVLRRARMALAGPVAARIAAALEAMGEHERLRRLLFSRLSWRRAAALGDIAQSGGRTARDLLLLGAADPALEVRRAALQGLLDLRDTISVRSAVLLYLRDLELRATCRKSFFAGIAASAPQVLRGLVLSSRLSAPEEKLALEALGDAGDALSTPFMLLRLEAEQPELRATAARALGKLESRGCLPALIERLGDSEWFVRAAAARALSRIQIGDAECRALAAALHDRVWWVRTNAARALSRQGRPGTDVLIETLDSGDRSACLIALSALAFCDLDPVQRRRLDGPLERVVEEANDPAAVALLRANPAFPRS